jgi:hypothetical protein
MTSLTLVYAKSYPQMEVETVPWNFDTIDKFSLSRVNQIEIFSHTERVFSIPDTDCSANR